mgnify:CR=1 FL=1
MLTQESGTGESRGQHPAEIIYREQQWLDSPGADAAALPRGRILASRWAGQSSGHQEHESSVGQDCHVLGIALRPIDEVTVYAARKLITSGRLPRIRHGRPLA